MGLGIPLPTPVILAAPDLFIRHRLGCQAAWFGEGLGGKWSQVSCPECLRCWGRRLSRHHWHPVGVQLYLQPAVSQGSPMWSPAMPGAVLTAGSPAKGSSASSSEPWQTGHLESPALVSLPGELTWARPTAYPLSPDQASLGHSVKTRVCWRSLCLLLLTPAPRRCADRRGPALRKLPAVGKSGSHK